MSYPAIEDKDFLDDLLRRKELYSLRADSARNFRDPAEAKEDPLTGKYLKIHSHQIFVRNFMNPNTPYKRLHLMHGCHATGTKILMYDGTIKNVEEIDIGEQLMGDDGTPRNVLSLVAGRETMYKVVPTKGESFICNKSHILTIRNSATVIKRCKRRQIEDIKISDFLLTQKAVQERATMYTVGVDFVEKPVEIDPYMIGFWLGDGSSYGPMITTQDAKVVRYFTQECPKFGAYFQYKSQYDYSITTGNHGGELGCNRFLATLQKYNLIKNKHIPYDYKCNSRENRLKLLAGLIDSDGFYDSKSHYFEIVQKSEKLIDDIIYLCRSLGFAAYKNPCVKKCTNSPNPNHSDTYYRVFIHGNKLGDVPTMLDRKRACNDERDDHLLTRFRLEELPEDDYYGFELDGNHRYLLGNFIVTHNTGTGKTLAAISIAQEFIKVYRKMYANLAAKTQASRRNYSELDRGTPTVFVLGFGGTKSAFIRDLMKHPEFGFISMSEKEELVKRQKIADAGLPDDIKHLREYYSQLKKRITNKSKDGFYKFFGYDEFVNRLFLSEDVKLTDLEALATQKLRAGEQSTLEDIIYEYIQSGKIQVNHQLIAMFENSLLICDEIHNTYNMNMKNNRGVAIQFILDSVPTLRFLSLSATPINNSPTEVIELINYLVPADHKVTKKGFFANSRTLFPGKLEEIGKITAGRISFLQDANIKYFPKRVFLGEPVKLPKPVDEFPEGAEIPYLKFIPCPMSELHQRTYNRHLTAEPAESNQDGAAVLEEGRSGEQPRLILDVDTEIEELPRDDVHDEDEEEIIIGGPKYSYHSIPTDGYSIYDIVFPNPDLPDYGLFRSSEVRNKISLAPQEWKDKNKIQIKKFSALNNIITGDFLSREIIPKYSTKCSTLIDTLMQIVAQAGGDPGKCQKIMVYHDRVKMSGVLLLQELLRINNFLDEYSEPVDSTICCICGKALFDHTREGTHEHPHEYRPARFVVAHSDVDKVTMDQSLTKFNSPDNAHGMNYMILIGSKIIKESYDFKDIQNLIIMSLPINIPTLIQVFGRCIRKHSHINLPPEQRRVFIRILVSTINPDYESNDSISPEMYRYVDKLSDYIVIQNIEREFNRNAIDADIHRDIIMPRALLREYFPDGDDKPPKNTIGNLYFEPAIKLQEYKLDELNLSTFTAYKYYEEEVRTISFLIKRLFMMQTVWTYDDLWAAVRHPPIGVEMNPKLFSERNFIISLHNLVNAAASIISASKAKHEMTESMLIERIFDYNERYIYINGLRHKIEQISKYYILFPVADLPANPLNVVYAEYMEHVRDKERAMIKELSEPNDRVIIDVETYIRPLSKRAGVRINIESFVRESKANINYLAKKNQFVNEYKGREDIIGFLGSFSAQFQMSFLEEAIVHSITVAGGKQHGTNSADDTVVLYKKVIELLNQFGVVVFIKEIRKYKDTAKQYKNGLPELPDDTPLGYMTAKSVRLFDPLAETEGKWIEVSKIALNRHMVYKENEIIVGFLESEDDYMKFKLRKPVHKIKEDIAKDSQMRKLSKSEMEGMTARTTVGDTRLIERGIVCSTKNKNELLQIIASLGISTSKLAPGEIRIKRLCEIIKRKLVENEIKERQKNGRYKYLYSWWDEQMSIASLI